MSFFAHFIDDKHFLPSFNVGSKWERVSSGHENGTKIYVILTITTVCEFFTIKKDQDQTQFASSNTWTARMQQTSIEHQGVAPESYLT